MPKKATLLCVDIIYNLNKNLELTDGTITQSILEMLSQPDQDGQSLLHNIYQFNSKRINFNVPKTKKPMLSRF